MAESIEKDYKILYKYYVNEFKQLGKHGTTDRNYTLNSFITSLRYLRDRMILLNDSKNNLLLTSLAVAISEFEEYTTCINKYYKLNDSGCVEIADSSVSREDTLTAYTAEKSAHWTQFWYLVSANLENWLGTVHDDYTI